MKISKILLLLSVVVLSGCIANRTPYNQPTKVSNVEIVLAEAADSISHSLVDLSRTEKLHKPARKQELTSFSPMKVRELQGTASIDWSGPIEPLVAHLAQTSRYKFNKIGEEPAVPIIVTISKKDSRVSTILQEIDYLAGDQAFIKVNPARKTIELRYA